MKRATRKKRVYKSIEEFRQRFYPKPAEEEQSEVVDPSAFGAKLARESLEKYAGMLSNRQTR